MKLPMKFTVKSSSDPGMQTTWEASMKELDPIKIAIPPEFNGPGNGYSPEDLLSIAALTCMIATFKVYAEKVGVEYEQIEGTTEMTIDKPDKEPIAITMLKIDITLSGASDKEKARKVLEDAKKSCLVSNTLKSDIQFVLNVS